jgi:hypothetical protein
MTKLIVKITFNPKNPADAELIDVLKDVDNRSAHIKLAAYHYFRILERLSAANSPQVNTDCSAPGNGGHDTKTAKKVIPQWEMEALFADAFKEL